MNKHRGTFLLKLGNQEFTLCYTINAICSMEEALGTPGNPKPIAEIAELLVDPEKISITLARAMLWAGLQKHHGNYTIRDAGDMIDEYGLEAVVTQIVAGFATAFPTGDDSPQIAEGGQAGNGLSS